jgi:outer membrane beta-barrel protein
MTLLNPSPSLTSFMRNRFPKALVALLVTVAPAARAAEPEKEVVRNRLYRNEGKIEAGAQVGFSLINRLTDHTNFQAVGAYNFTNEWAAEVFAGYALSKHTSIADQVTGETASVRTATTPRIDDFSSLWELKWNVTAGARWAPIYGKLSLSAELPIHFNFYLAAGAGVAGTSRTSVTYCQSQTPAQDSNGSVTCLDPLVESRVTPVVQFGAGLRFFVGDHVALRLEARDFAFPDKYRVDIDRTAAETEGPGGDPQQGTQASSPGFQHVVFLTAGLSYIF